MLVMVVMEGMLVMVVMEGMLVMVEMEENVGDGGNGRECLCWW